MGRAWEITDWELFYERAGDHRPEREIVYRWVAFTTKHDGKSYRRLTRHPHGERAMLAFFMMVEVAAKQPKRGTLADENGPLDAEDLAAATGWSSELFDVGFKVLSEPKIGWIRPVDFPIESGVVRSSPPTGQDITGHYRTLQDSKPLSTEASVSTPGTASKTAPASGDDSAIVLSFPTKAGKNNKMREWQLRQNHLDELVAGFPFIDVRAECFKALAHVKATSENVHTNDGMKSFLFRWMGRTDRWRLARREAGQGRPGPNLGADDVRSRVQQRNAQREATT